MGIVLYGYLRPTFNCLGRYLGANVKTWLSLKCNLPLSILDAAYMALFCSKALSFILLFPFSRAGIAFIKWWFPIPFFLCEIIDFFPLLKGTANLVLNIFVACLNMGY